MSPEMEKPKVCPQCGQSQVQRMIHGRMTDEAVKKIQEKEDVYHAGCIVDGYWWRCKDCGWQWGEPGKGKYGWKPTPISWFKKIMKSIEKYQNEGPIDRFIRAVVGIELILISFFNLSGTWQIAGYIVGAVLIVTAIDGFCALYVLFGINTKKK